MTLTTLYFLMVITAQLYYAVRTVIEATACDWSRQAKWIAGRFLTVLGDLLLFTLTVAVLLRPTDDVLLYILHAGIAAMTVLVGLHLPDILAGMADEQVGEDLNIYIKKDK